ncbi:acetyl-CoA synthetase [Streptomyces sp. NPDC056682]|uniref:acetyl-CoA synthetase n=1 Tax=Streptomyces sp. NPDC056682 TaxID=3345909 RepID=UPI0036947DBF
MTTTHGSTDPAARRLCVRPGTTVTVVLEPRPGGSWPPPHTSSPMLATVTATATDRDGTSHVTLRAARTGSVTITWGPVDAPAFTLQLDVAAYPVQ